MKFVFNNHKKRWVLKGMVQNRICSNFFISYLSGLFLLLVESFMFVSSRWIITVKTHKHTLAYYKTYHDTTLLKSYGGIDDVIIVLMMQVLYFL